MRPSGCILTQALARLPPISLISLSFIGVLMVPGDIGFLRDVAMDIIGTVAGGAQRGREILAGAISDVAEEDMRAFARHRLGDRVADAVGSAGDDCGFSFETSHVSLHSRAGASL